MASVRPGQHLPGQRNRVAVRFPRPAWHLAPSGRHQGRICKSTSRIFSGPLWDLPEVRRREKSTQQSVATTAYAALSRNWEGKGGRHSIELCHPFKDANPTGLHDDSYAPRAYDAAFRGGIMEGLFENRTINESRRSSRYIFLFTVLSMHSTNARGEDKSQLFGFFLKKKTKKDS